MSLSIALTKGRLEKDAVELLDLCGYGTEKLKNKGRALVFEDTREDIRYFLVKANDCITYVEHGVADCGIVGKDTLMEGGSDYYELLDLKIGKCKFIIAGMKDHNPLTMSGNIRIGSKYPEAAKRYFLSRGLDAEMIRLEGSVELAPVLGLCDGIMDIMETGRTLKENGLVVYDTVCDISARVIVNKASFKIKRQEIMKFLTDMERAVEERCSE